MAVEPLGRAGSVIEAGIVLNNDRVRAKPAAGALEAVIQTYVSSRSDCGNGMLQAAESTTARKNGAPDVSTPP